MYNNLKIGYNIYEVLYIEEIEETKTPIKEVKVHKKRKRGCDDCYKDFRHKSYRNIVNKNSNIVNQKKNINTINHIIEPLFSIRSYDKFPIPIDENIILKKPKLQRSTNKPQEPISILL